MCRMLVGKIFYQDIIRFLFFLVNFPYSINQGNISVELLYPIIPARVDCYGDWTKEYSGYLMGGHHSPKKSSDYTRVDSDPETIPGLGHGQNGHLLYFVEVNCGSAALPCPPYVHGREIGCVVCTK